MSKCAAFQWIAGGKWHSVQWVGIVSKGLPALKVSGIGSGHIFLCIEVFSCAVFAQAGASVYISSWSSVCPLVSI